MTGNRIVELANAIDTDDPVSGLAATVRLRAELERTESVLVRRARVNGVTWAQIATILGVSKQAVHKKYSARSLLGRHT
ncbi:hypothetical protein [Williamsia muralis]|uniref:hypothetical protein n=1 Tax=Williamsia marianensis TaxID=85044 RepID=UPI003F5CC627